MMNPQATHVGKYELKQLVGQGAMGAVYRAHDPSLDRDVAIKVMSASLADEAQLRQRFHAEARAAGSLQHPNIVTIYDFGEADGGLFIAMEFLAGRDLSTIIRERAPLSLPEKLDIARGVLAGLSYAHAHGVVHRDIKPGNVRIMPDGQVKIMDFGVAHLSGTELTSDGTVLGTPTYMAPEQVRAGHVGPAADLFSLGAVLYELLAYRKPFCGDTPHAVLYQVIQQDPPPLHELNPAVPSDVERVVKRAMAKDPKARYPSADAMATALRAARDPLRHTQDISTLSVFGADTPLPLPTPPRPRRRREMLFGLGGLGIVAVAAGITFGLAPRGRPAGPDARVAELGLPLASAPVLATQRAAAKPPGQSSPAPIRIDGLAGGSRPGPPAAGSSAPVRVNPTGEDDQHAVAAAIDDLAAAVSSRDVDRLLEAYPGLDPGDGERWRAFFDAVRTVRAELVVETIVRAADTLWADVSGRLVYEEHHSGRRRQVAARFVTTFERSSAGWSLAAIHSTSPASATESPLN